MVEFNDSFPESVPSSEGEGEYYKKVVSYEGETTIIDTNSMEIDKPHPFVLKTSEGDVMLFLVRRLSGEFDVYGFGDYQIDNSIPDQETEN